MAEQAVHGRRSARGRTIASSFVGGYETPMAGAFGIIHPEKLGQLEMVEDGLGMIWSFANVGVVFGGGGALLVDVATAMLAPNALEVFRGVTDEPLSHIVYTHGHVDHVGGAALFAGDAESRGNPRPSIWAHQRVLARFERYRQTWGWNNEVNRRQFAMPKGAEVFPKDFVPPDHTYEQETSFQLGTERVELFHAEAETDDATWVWLPERRAALVGDLIIHSMPNTGNPNKAQRNTLGWADALEAIANKKPNHVLPGHGPPVRGDFALEMLTETARALRFLHDAVLERLNDGRWPDEIVDEDLKLPSELHKKPYLAPLYGCRQFVVRDVLRRYAGWWGGDPADLIPAPRSAVAKDLVDLMPPGAIVDRIRELQASGELRRALHLAMTLHTSAPDDGDARALTAGVLEALAESEPSYIARNFYAAAAMQLRASRE